MARRLLIGLAIALTIVLGVPLAESVARQMPGSPPGTAPLPSPVPEGPEIESKVGPPPDPGPVPLPAPDVQGLGPVEPIEEVPNALPPNGQDDGLPVPPAESLEGAGAIPDFPGQLPQEPFDVEGADPAIPGKTAPRSGFDFDPEVHRAALQDQENDPLPEAREQPPEVLNSGSGASSPQSGGGDPYNLADRVSEGPQDLGLLVDVLAPPVVNLNKEMKLSIRVRNTGSADAFNLVVRDLLPSSLEFVSASPKADEMVDAYRLWYFDRLRAQEEKTIELTVKPIEPVAFLHTPTVDFRTGAKSSTKVLKPELKVKVTAKSSRLLKGKPVDFDITVTNNGNGPAKDVEVRAIISDGFRVPGEDDKARSFSQILGTLGPGESQGPFPFSVDAVGSGTQSCQVIVSSPDVVPAGPESKDEASIEVVAPELKLVIDGQARRPKGSEAHYKIIIENTGTAPALNVAIGAFPPVDGGTPTIPPNAERRDDGTSRTYKIYWYLKELPPKQREEFELPIRLDTIQDYILSAGVNAQAEDGGPVLGTIYASTRTEVTGMPLVEYVDVNCRRRVLDVGDETEFEIRIRNFGSKEATQLRVGFRLSDNLEILSTEGGPNENSEHDPNTGMAFFGTFDRLEPERDLVLKVFARATKPGPAQCEVGMTWAEWQGALVTRSTYTTVAELEDGVIRR